MQIETNNTYQYDFNQQRDIAKEGAKPLIDKHNTQEVDPTLKELQATDSAVRAHEAAHLAAGGGVVTGGANFSYERGSDGKMYAVAGEVPIDSGEASTPEATIQKARQIVAAAMAPADPSPQDYRVAASAMVMEIQARTEQMRQEQAKISGNQTYAQAMHEESA